MSKYKGGGGGIQRSKIKVKTKVGSVSKSGQQNIQVGTHSAYIARKNK